MVITLNQDLTAALTEQARKRGIAPEALAISVLRERLLPPAASVEPRDEWERTVLGAATDCGVSRPHSALTSDGLYE